MRPYRADPCPGAAARLDGVLRLRPVNGGTGELPGAVIDDGHPDRRVPDANVVAFPYDFRRSVAEAAERLAADVTARLSVLGGEGPAGPGDRGGAFDGRSGSPVLDGPAGRLASVPGDDHPRDAAPGRAEGLELAGRWGPPRWPSVAGGHRVVPGLAVGHRTAAPIPGDLRRAHRVARYPRELPAAGCCPRRKSLRGARGHRGGVGAGSAVRPGVRAPDRLEPRHSGRGLLGRPPPAGPEASAVLVVGAGLGARLRGRDGPGYLGPAGRPGELGGRQDRYPGTRAA